MVDDLRSEELGFRFEGVVLRPVGVSLEPERLGLRPGGAGLRPGRAGLRLGSVELSSLVAAIVVITSILKESPQGGVRADPGPSPVGVNCKA